MDVKCIRKFGDLKVGDIVQVPDGSAVSPVFFEPVNGSGDQNASGE